MTDLSGTEALRRRLEDYGDPRRFPKWETGDVDYPANLGLSAADVPELLAIAKEWAQERDWPEDENDMSAYAPVHAWRALAQLRAMEAVVLFLEMLDPLDATGDDWYLEDFPYAFGWIGSSAVPALASYLADDSHAVYTRVCVGHGLREVARRCADARDEVVKALCEALTEFARNDASLNAFLVTYLLEIEATEAAALIERAYAADRVDVAVVGNWNAVRRELGVNGLELVPEHLARQRAWPLLGQPVQPSASSAPMEPSSSSSGPSRKRQRAKRKRERKNRRHNRKR